MTSYDTLHCARVCNRKQSVGSSEDERLLIDPSDVESSYAYTDAKRKLRLVLSASDLPGESLRNYGESRLLRHR